MQPNSIRSSNLVELPLTVTKAPITNVFISSSLPTSTHKLEKKEKKKNQKDQ